MRNPCRRSKRRSPDPCPAEWRSVAPASLPYFNLTVIAAYADSFLLNGSPELEALAALGIFEVLGLAPSVNHAVDHREIRENGENPQHRRHPVEQAADDQQYDTLGPLEEPDLTFWD